MRRMSGPLLVATGVLDILYVLVSYSRQFAAIFQEGLVDAVEVIPAQLDRETAFWHLMFGATFVVLGGLVCWTQSRTGLRLLARAAGAARPSGGAPGRDGGKNRHRLGRIDG